LTDRGHSAEHARALGVLLAGACVIGVGPILVRLADCGPVAAGLWRLIFALPGLALLAQGAGGIGAPPRIALLAGLAFALDLGFWHYGIAFTSVANATVLSNLTPVVVTLVAWIFLRERPRTLFILAVVMAVGGAWLMAEGRPAGAPGANPPLGDALSAFTAVWYALYFLAVSKGRRTIAASRIMFWSSVVGVPILLIGAFGLGERILPQSAVGWAAVAGLGAMHIAGQGSIAWALGRLPAATASVVVLVQPIVAALLGWLMFREALGPLQAIGAAVALGGVVVAQRVSRPKPVASDPATAAAN
jgi:drug/metabolite transporter (DMT)-like permease